MIDTYAVPYKESMALHTKVYPNEQYKSLAMQVDEVLGQLQKRLTFLDEMIPKLSAVDNVEMGNDNRPVAVYDLNGFATASINCRNCLAECTSYATQTDR